MQRLFEHVMCICYLFRLLLHFRNEIRISIVPLSTSILQYLLLSDVYAVHVLAEGTSAVMHTEEKSSFRLSSSRLRIATRYVYFFFYVKVNPRPVLQEFDEIVFCLVAGSRESEEWRDAICVNANDPLLVTCNWFLV